MSRSLLSFVLLLGVAHAARAGPDDPLIEACIGPARELRLAGEGCRPSEQAIAWQRGGGVWVHDAEGRPLGRALGRGGGRRLYLDGSGLRVQISTTHGRLLPLPSSIYFTEPDCQGLVFSSRSSTPGELISVNGFSPTSPIFVSTDRMAAGVAFSYLTSSGCQDFGGPRSFPELQEVVRLAQGQLGFEPPVPVPLRFGTGPLGDAGEELIRACAGPRGRLRIAGPEACERGEAAVAWQRLGGLRVYDGAGRDLGAALGADVTGREPGLLLTANGAWIQPDPLSGVLREPPVRAYEEPDCRGESFVDDLFLLNVGRVFEDTTPGEFVIATREALRDAAFRSTRIGGVCRNGSGFRHGLRLEPYLGPLPAFPLATPIVVGFPGSPLANPDGPAVAAGLVHACAGPHGRLRRVEADEPCLPSEHGLRWPHRGGLRALDADGTELGAFLDRAYSSSRGDNMRIIDDASGLRFGVRFDNGQLGDDEILSPVRLSFTGSGCTGTVFRRSEPIAGLVFPFAGRLGVGVRIDALPERSFFAFGLCLPGVLFPNTPLLSTVVEEFTGVVPFPLPVATPLLVGPGN